MNRVARSALLLAVAGAAWGAPGAPGAMAQPPALRYVSFNILHGGALSGWRGNGEDLEARLAIAVDELRRLDPDVIGIQEASVTRRRGNVAERLGRELGFHYVFSPALFQIFRFALINRQVSGLMNFQEGPAILSRFPLVEWEPHELPRCHGFFDPRVLVYARVRTPWGDLGVASAHTSQGFCEAERVIELLQSRRGALPLVLMGDFNAREESPAIRRVVAAGLVDAFRAANPTDPGRTTWQGVHAQASTVFARIDYVFVLPGYQVPGRVLSSRVVLNAPRRFRDGAALWPSDHYGVLAELDVFGAGATATTRATGSGGGEGAGTPAGAPPSPEPGEPGPADR